MCRFLFACLVCLVFFLEKTAAQLLLNEVAPTNPGITLDQDGDPSDWFEVFNAGFLPVNLGGHSLTDDGAKPQKWSFPAFTLDPGQRLLVFASGKDRSQLPPGTPDHWETALFDDDGWQYFVGTTAPPNKWNFKSFNAQATWPTGKGSIGYGDGDDSTLVAAGSISVYYRLNFTVADASKLTRAQLSMDYDDGFVAYLNGIEIARSQGLAGNPPDFQTTAPDHEAAIYAGGGPEKFEIDPALLAAELQTGDNVLAIQLHNGSVSSSDLTGRTWLHFGVADGSVFFPKTNPPFFQPPTAGLELHTNFKLNSSEKLRLFSPSGQRLDSISLAGLQPGHVRARISDGDSWCISDEPSPGQVNGGQCFTGYSPTPGISLASGFYTGSQSVDLFGQGVIRFTTDGSEPVDTSPIFANSLIFNASGVLRARSFLGLNLPGAVVTAAYFIDEPTTLPVVSIVAQPDDFFFNGNGGPAIYDSKTGKTGCRIAFFDKSKTPVFEENASATVVGNYSVDFPQKSLQFVFSEEYGAAADVPNIFKTDKPGIEKLHGFRVRNMDDDAHLARMRDVVSNRISLPTHSVSAGCENVAVFINGQYWGHYVARELLDEWFCRDNFGSNPDRVDMIKTAYATSPTYFAEEGSDTSFFQMSDWLLAHSMALPANFEVADSLVDWRNWVDYFATEIYIQNGDWFPSMYFNNIRLFSSKRPDRKWKFMLWDTNYSQYPGETASNLLHETLAAPSFPNRYTDMMNSLLENPGFKNHFINRFADLLNWHFNPLKINELIDKNALELAPEIDAQASRWGSADLAGWQGAVSDLKNFHTGRRAFVRNHIEDEFDLAGQVNVTLKTVPAGAGFIQISTIMPDELPWTGVYFKGVPVEIRAVAAPGFSFSGWSANPFIGDLASPTATVNIAGATTFTANFTGAAATAELVVSEINYHSDPQNDAGDWLELWNASPAAPLDLTGWTMEDSQFFNRFELPAGTILPANGRLILFENGAKFTVEHPPVSPKIGPLPFDLSNGGDQILLRNAAQDTFLRVRFSDKNGWPTEADGAGKTLEFLSGMNPNLPASWFAGCPGGSPGAAFDPLCGISSTAFLPMENGQLVLFPNPTSDLLFLKTGLSQTGSLEIFDALGRLVFFKKEVADDDSFSVKRLPAGVFQVVFQTGNGRFSGRFLKMD